MTTLDESIFRWVSTSSLPGTDKMHVIDKLVQAIDTYEELLINSTLSDRAQQWQPNLEIDFRAKTAYNDYVQKLQESSSKVNAREGITEDII